MNELSLFTHVTEGVTSNDYYTPKWIFDALGLEFDIDVCAPVQGIPWIPAKRWFSQADDGLAQDWGGALVWMNPPFSKPGPWIDKFIENGNGITLVAMSRSGSFSKLWNKANALMALPHNLSFITPEGKEKGVYMPCILASVGDQATQALHNMKMGRVR